MISYNDILAPEVLPRLAIRAGVWLSLPNSTFVGPQFTEPKDDYDAYANLFGEGMQTAARDLLSTAIPKLSHSSLVLEVGAGTGHATHAFLSLKPEFSVLFANDISERMLIQCDKKLKHFGDDISKLVFLSADISEQIFKADIFDVIYGFAILHHLLDYQSFLKEVYRILRPGGLFLALEPMSDTHLLAAIVLQLSLYISEVRGQPFAPDFKKTVDSYCNNVISRSHKLLSQKELAEMDDKHLFNPRSLIEDCKRIGFNEVSITRQPGTPESGCYSFIEQQLRGLGVTGLNEAETVTKLVDRIMPELFQSAMGPRGVIRLIK